jgi:N-acetylglucosaminyldiphosphoundecaprenol N-acetyl-beta-D-mannosaminyltransferase
MRNFLINANPGSVHYFLGSTQESHLGIQNFINSKSKHKFNCHFYSPTFGLDWKQEINSWIEMIDSKKADYIWVGMGAPKQFKIASEITSRSGKTTFSVGAAFDFIAETKRESPKWLNELGLEWAYRLCSEPNRLFHRYTIGNFQFLSILLRNFFNLIFQRIYKFLSRISNSLGQDS